MDLQRVWAEAVETYPFLAAIPPIKTPTLLASYEQVLPLLPPNPRILELGIYKGGSLVLWSEALDPARVVGIDFAKRPAEADVVDRYGEASGRGERIRMHWSTSQAQIDRLTAILKDDLGGAADLIIDDASHMFTPTRISLLTLFPAVSPGGFYVIEDWATDANPNFHDPNGSMRELVFDLVGHTQRGLFGIDEMRITGGSVILRHL
jgi:cephalosporin hydroxylase